jgi:hypothetical protein
LPRLVEPARVEALGVDPTVDDLVDGALVAVEGEDHRLVRGEEVDERCLVHPVRVVVRWEERHEVHDIHHPHLHLGQVLA